MGVILKSLGFQKESPTVIKATAPIFPPVAVAGNISGNVILNVQVRAETGEVIGAQIIDGHPLLRQIKALEDTAKRWQFKALQAETNTQSVRLEFLFKIMPKDTQDIDLTPIFISPYKVEVRHRPFEPITHSDPPTRTIPEQKGKKL